MRWWILFSGVLLLFSGGCKSGNKLVDPFVGQTRVEPPRTGSITGVGDPFYAGQSSTYSPPASSGATYPGWSNPASTSTTPGWTPMLSTPPGTLPQNLPSSPSGTNAYPSLPRTPQSGAAAVPGTGPAMVSPPAQGASTPSSYPSFSGSGTSLSSGQTSSGIMIPSGSSLSVTGGTTHGGPGNASGFSNPGGTNSSGAVPPSGVSPPPNNPASLPPTQQPIIRTLEPRANSQPGVHLASSTPGSPSSSVGTSANISSGPVVAGGGIPTSGAFPGRESLPSGSSGGAGTSIDLASLPSGQTSSGSISANSSSRGAAGAASAGSTPASGGGGGNGSGTPAAPTSSTSAYGFDPQYQWLRGVLCYSAAEGCWRLRYLPPGCTGDRLGGWVILCHPSGLGGFCSGQQVEVRGQLIYKQMGNCQVPIYQVQDIRRIRA